MTLSFFFGFHIDIYYISFQVLDKSPAFIPKTIQESTNNLMQMTLGVFKIQSFGTGIRKKSQCYLAF